MEDKKELLRQANVLTESRYDFDKIQKRCLYKVIEKVRKDYIEGERTLFDNMQVFMPQSFLDAVAGKQNRKIVRESLFNLRQKTIEIEEKDGSWLLCGFINWAKYDANKKEYEVEVSSQIMPYLVELASKYTEYNLTVAISLKSKWSQRFYELCCQYRTTGKFGKTIDQLRKMFMLEDLYPNLKDFKSCVINKAQKELKAAYEVNDCDVWFDYIQTGKGLNAHFEFFVHSKERDARQQEIWADLNKESNYIGAVLTATFRKDPKYVSRVIHALNLDPNLIRPIFNKITKAEKDFKGGHLARILRFLLKEDFHIE